MSFDFESGSVPSEFLNDVDYPWTITTSNVYAGTYSLRCGPHSGTHSVSANLYLMGDVAAGDFEYYMDLDTEAGWDYHYFFVDNSEEIKLSGSGSYSQQTVAITAGHHIFHWAYSKDSSSAPTDDGVWIDDITHPTATWIDPADGDSMNALPTGTEWTNDATYPWELGGTRGIGDANHIVSDQGLSGIHNVTSDFEYNSDSGAGSGAAYIVFNASSENGGDFFDWLVDATSIDTDWGDHAGSADESLIHGQVKEVTAGAHEYIFRYSKDASGEANDDEGRLHFFYEPGMSAPAEPAIGDAWVAGAWESDAWASDSAWAQDGSTPTTVSSPVVTHTYTGQTPQVDVSVQPGVVTHTYTGQAPEAQESVAAVVATHSYTGQAPQVQANVQPGAATHTYTGQAPEARVGVTAAVATHTYAGQAPQVQSDVSPDPATHTYTGEVPTAGAGAIVGAVVATHTYTGQAPQAQSSVQPDQATHTYAGQAPGLETSFDAPAASHSYAGQAPQVQASVMPGAVTHTYTAWNPLISDGVAPTGPGIEQERRHVLGARGRRRGAY